MQVFCFGLYDSVGLVGIKMALYAQYEPKIFPLIKLCINICFLL
jgi:hypothetical protein